MCTGPAEGERQLAQLLWSNCRVSDGGVQEVAEREFRGVVGEHILELTTAHLFTFNELLRKQKLTLKFLSLI